MMNRSGWSYERSGFPFTLPVNAIRFPSGESAMVPMSPSMLATFTIAPPFAGTEYNSGPPDS